MSDPGMEPYPPRVQREIDFVPRGTLAARWLHELQPISNQPVGVEFPHRAGWYRSVGCSFSSTVCCIRRDFGRCSDPEMGSYPPGCGGISTLAREATLAARWLHEPQLITNKSASGVEVSTPCGAVLNRRISAFVPGLFEFREMEGFLIKGCDIILPGCGGTSTLDRRATLAARWLQLQPITDQPVGLGFPHHAERSRPGGSPFSSLGCWSCRVMEGFLIQG